MKKSAIALLALACFVLSGCTLNISGSTESATSSKSESTLNEVISSSETENNENSEGNNDDEVSQSNSSALDSNSNVNLPELVEIGYATEGPGGWDEIVALSDSQKAELYELLKTDTWEEATDLPDGVGFGDGVLRARDSSGRCMVTVLGIIEAKSLTLLVLDENGTKTFYYASKDVFEAAQNFSESLANKL